MIPPKPLDALRLRAVLLRDRATAIGRERLDLMTLRELLAANGRTIGFGYALALLSTFGQTSFLALSVPDLRAAFGLSHGEFGLIYSGATLVSGLLMIWVGGLLDQVSVRVYATFALSGLAFASLGLSLAPNLVGLGLALFALRLCGQGMLSHAAVTSTARLPDGIRGRAIGIATLGFPTGEALLPAAGLASLALLGLPKTWQVIAVLLALGIVAGLLGLSRTKALDRAPSPVPAFTPDPTAPRRLDILKDRRFLIFIPSIIAPSATLTAYVFHQRYIAEVKGWPLELLAVSVTSYALTSLATTFVTGALVDRFGAIALSRFYLLGIAGAGVVLATLDGPLVAPLVFALLGLTAGGNNTVLSSILAEIFGTRHLGRIRALAGSLSVVASATTPGTVGLLFDRGVTPAAVGLGFSVYVIAASLLNAAFLRR